ncbi:winged helix-turn-helix transcriptional regulator [Nocardia sp. NPDC088792]|uniref:winged helix-turn-helix transcriptional regulator n=1 Tax=Nocardia sp. NPDC088792 TaxID=3364332 RepID=UPI0038118B7B
MPNHLATTTLSTSHTTPRRGPAAILAAAVLWGSTGTAASLAPAGTPAAAIGSAGLALGGLLLFLTAHGDRLRGNGSARLRYRRPERLLLVLGACAVAGYPVTFYPAVARTGVAVATVVALGSAPVFAGLLTWATGQGRPSPRWTAATLLAVTGCAVLVLGPVLLEHGAGRSGSIDVLGIGLAACGGLTYAVYSLIGGKLIARGHDSSRVMGAMFGPAALPVLPVILHAGFAWLATPRGAAVAAHLALLTTFLAYRLFGYGLRHTTVAVATTLTLAEPAVAAVLGVSVVGERLPLVSWCGMAILAAGLVVLCAGSVRQVDADSDPIAPTPEVSAIANQVFGNIANKWALLVIDVLGAETLRFGQIKARVEGVSHKMLTQTLRNLERDGIIERTPYATVPPRVDYHLTEAGHELQRTVHGLCHWTRSHLDHISTARARFDSAGS